MPKKTSRKKKPTVILGIENDGFFAIKVPRGVKVEIRSYDEEPRDSHQEYHKDEDDDLYAVMRYNPKKGEFESDPDASTYKPEVESDDGYCPECGRSLDAEDRCSNAHCAQSRVPTN
jgi:hypothetical protein